MANWWDSAPLAEPVKAQSQSGNWWDAAPIAKNEPVSDIERAKAELAKGLREVKSAIWIHTAPHRLGQIREQGQQTRLMQPSTV